MLGYLHHHHLAPAGLRPRAPPDLLVPADRLPPEAIDSRAVLRFAGRYTYAMLRLDFGILTGITNSDPNFGISAGATYVIMR